MTGLILPIAWLVYFAVGYPVLLLLAALFSPRPVKQDDVNLPTVTLIISAFNEEKCICQKLENTLALSYPRKLLRIIVAVDGATDRTGQIVESFATEGIEMRLHKERRGKISVMNEAVFHTDGEIIVFSDANTWYHPDALRNLVRSFADPTVGMVCGRLTLLEGRYASVTRAEGMYWNYEHLLKMLETASGSTVGVVGSIYAVRRPLYKGYPMDTLLDDLIVGMSVIRQGFRVVYEPEALAREVMVASTVHEFSRKIRLAAGGFQAISRQQGLLQDHPGAAFRLFSHKVSRWLLPLPLAAMLISGICQSRQGKPALLRLLLAFHLSPLPEIFFRIGRQKITGRQDIKVRWTFLPFYINVMAVAALVGFLRFTSGKQTVRWRMTR